MVNDHPGSGRSLHVLIVEDSAPDTLLLVRALQRGGFHVKHQQVFTASALAQAVAQRRWDLVLADHSMPGFSALEALRIIRARGLDVPFIIVSGHIDEETAVAAMK